MYDSALIRALPKQEISEILAGRMTNQDEEEVEDELAVLEAEVAGKAVDVQQPLPSVPDTQLPTTERTGEEARTEPMGRRKQRERQAMLAS